MKNVKKLVALLIVIAMAACLSACHPKGETAISSGDVKITSAMYSYYLVMADMEAKNKVAENTDTSAKNFNYSKQEIDGKKFNDYVKDLALQSCLKAVAYQKLCAEKGVTPGEDVIANAEYNAQYNWNYYGYQYGYQYGYNSFLPQNGVSYETYVDVVKHSFYGDTYFKHLYAEGGEKEISKEDIQKSLDENYSAAYVLKESYTDDSTLTTAKEKLTGYIDRLNKGESYKTIYDEQNPSDQNVEEENEESTDSETPKPKDKFVTIIGSDKAGANYKFAKYDEIKAMEKDEKKLIEDSDEKVVYLVIKKDINEDSYYKDTLLKSEILYLIKGDEFKTMVDEYIKTMKYDVSKFATNRFKVKNIKYGE